MRTKAELMSEGYSETYITISEYSIAEIRNALDKQKITKENAQDFLDRVYELTSELPEDRWGETTKIKMQIRDIKEEG